MNPPSLIGLRILSINWIKSPSSSIDNQIIQSKTVSCNWLPRNRWNVRQNAQNRYADEEQENKKRKDNYAIVKMDAESRSCPSVRFSGREATRENEKRRISKERRIGRDAKDIYTFFFLMWNKQNKTWEDEKILRNESLQRMSYLYPYQIQWWIKIYLISSHSCNWGD